MQIWGYLAHTSKTGAKWRCSHVLGVLELHHRIQSLTDETNSMTDDPEEMPEPNRCSFVELEGGELKVRRSSHQDSQNESGRHVLRRAGGVTESGEDLIIPIDEHRRRAS